MTHRLIHGTLALLLPPGFSLLLCAWGLSGQISPGELSRPHSELSGPLSCTKCHAFGKGQAELKCLECHREIALGITEKRGYHVRKIKPGTGSNDCARCHSEHNGKESRLVRWPVAKEKFDHTEAGWKLEGKHAALRCAQCHIGKNLDPRLRPVIDRRSIDSTLMGLNTACVSCHRDIHAGQLSKDCTTCHTLDTWKSPPNFSHEKTAYPLTGLHTNLECGKCHSPAQVRQAGLILYRTFPSFATCASCHQDPHGGAFQNDCQKCHTTGGWKTLNATNRFDHSKARFPLLGKHAEAACKTCHKTENFRAVLAFGRCLDCHKDPHNGQFARRADGGDCRSCHGESTWKKASFTVSDHANTAYPLLEKHEQVTCDRCHVPAGKDTKYKVPFGACSDCHRDQHTGQFAAFPHQNRCDDCHTLHGFQPSTFTLTAHKKTTFALRGAHAAAPCTSCHTPKKTETPYHPVAGNCADCHNSPHGKLPAGLTCEGCHTTGAWKERGEFDHGRTTFPLLAKHRTADCLACHKPGVQAGAVRQIDFRGTPKDCAACHTDVHDGQFRAVGEESNCARCHTVANWNPTEFDHARHSNFRLGPSHEQVPCGMCHDQKRQVAGRTIVTYKGTPRECSACHK